MNRAHALFAGIFEIVKACFQCAAACLMPALARVSEVVFADSRTAGSQTRTRTTTRYPAGKAT
jgi:hypothetical protein